MRTREKLGTLVICRHGKSVYQKERATPPYFDLTPQGIQETVEAAQRLKTILIDRLDFHLTRLHIKTSPQLRAKMTAVLFGHELGIHHEQPTAFQQFLQHPERLDSAQSDAIATYVQGLFSQQQTIAEADEIGISDMARFEHDVLQPAIAQMQTKTHLSSDSSADAAFSIGTFHRLAQERGVALETKQELEQRVFQLLRQQVAVWQTTPQKTYTLLATHYEIGSMIIQQAFGNEVVPWEVFPKSSFFLVDFYLPSTTENPAIDVVCEISLINQEAAITQRKFVGINFTRQEFIPL